MPFCIKCGTRLPEDAQARFCPNCGASIFTQVPQRTIIAQRVQSASKAVFPSMKSRILVMLAAMLLCILVTVAGTLETVDPEVAHEAMQETDKLQDVLSVAGIQFIFGNNLMYCLVMFVPVLGSIFGFYVLYSTGWILAAMGTAVGMDPLLLFASLLFFPHFWLEYISYGLAISEGFWLLYMTRKAGIQGLKKESSYAAKAVTVCAVMLLLGAFVEMLVISG